MQLTANLLSARNGDFSALDRADQTSGASRNRMRAIAAAGATLAAGTALALNEHWLLISELQPLLYALPCAAMTLACLKAMGNTARGGEFAQQGQTARATAPVRRLAAILAADIVGYSRLMGEDEVGTAQAVLKHREAVGPIVESHGGRIVKTMGDGALLEFPSVVGAVECAIAIQTLSAQCNADIPANKRILYRVGVNLGDVLVKDQDIFGEGVNIAARLEAIAKPGGICLSASAFDHVRDRVEANFVDRGEKELKNIARPIRVYEISIGA